MAKQLLDLEIDEISLVDQPASKHAKVVIFKRDASGDKDLVSKCLEAVSKGDVSECTAGDFEQALDTLAKDRADRTGENFPKAYSKVLEGDQGGQLYTGLVAFDATDV